MKRRIVILLVGVFCILTMFPAAGAAEGKGGISISASLVPIGGIAGSEDFWADEPDYSDAFSVGWAGRVEPYFDFTPLIRGQFGVAYSSFGGSSIADSRLGTVKFDDLSMLSYYVGVKFRFMPKSTVRPYALANVGGTYIYSVDASRNNVTIPYFESTNTLFGDLGGGVEFKAGGNVSFFIEGRLQFIGAPDAASALAQDASAIVTFPISAGINIGF
jgi:hypothetical protein